MKNEELKKHKNSFEYRAGQVKYSAIIWTVGSAAISISLFLAIIGFRRTMMLREFLFFLFIVVSLRFFKKVKAWYTNRNASVGVALGLDTDPKFIKNLIKLDEKLEKDLSVRKRNALLLKREWLYNYLTDEGKKELEAMKRG